MSRPETKVDRLNRIVAAATHHREQLEAIEAELVMDFGYEPGSDEATEFAAVVWDGVPLNEALERVFEIKKRRR